MKTPARAPLGSRYRGLPLGYRVLTVDRQPYAGFTRAGVVETQPGYYVAAVEQPPAGGWIVWGTEANPNLVEAELLPLPPTVDLAPIREAIGTLARAMERQPAPVVVVDTDQFVAGLLETQQRVTTLIAAEQDRRAGDASALRAELGTIAQQVQALQRLNESAHQFAHLDAAAERFAGMTQLGERLTNAGLGIVDLMALTREFAQLRADITQLHEAAKRDASERQRAIDVIDNLLAIVGPA